MSLKKDYSSRRADTMRIPDPFELGKTDYVYMHIRSVADIEDFIGHPMRHHGLSVILCLKGRIMLDINTTPYDMRPNTLLCVTMGNVLSFTLPDDEELDLCVILVSQDFLRGLNFDINVLSAVKVEPGSQPFIHITEREMALLKAYFDLMHYNTMENTEAVFVKSISRNLFAAAVYQMLQIANRSRQRNEDDPPAEVSLKASRSRNYVRDFLNLVLMHHVDHREVAFYAEKLLLTPKYLSHVVKTITGRSAAEWIDYYVILEAKNLLRYSGKNVKQVAYQLNFPNQSAFGKYFKHLTGLSPTEFQRS